MSAGLMVLVTICYVICALVEASRGNYPASTVFGGYALANVGLIIGLLR
jgi:hypothetical protein